MSPTTKPVRNIKVKVPRHNSQRLGPAVTAQVENVARQQRVRVDVRQTAFESSSALAQAIDSASEWNSLLLTARANREDEDGPSTSTNADSKPVQEIPSTPKHQSLRGVHLPLGSQGSFHHPQQFFSGNTPTNMASPRHPFPNSGQGMGGQGMPGQSMGFGGMNMSPVSPAQFYGGGTPGMSQGMGNMGMNMPGGMVGGMGMGMGGDGMGGLGMNSPDPRRRLTRGMSGEDGYGSMH
ncbi:hypothetical protein POSPLADRAFT_1049121 [Postia placenta MAD-698-R-SB12]|uniref:Uncharacterized protein n=1 Tax=Postia placenta MAD-698-R-SB12 TaxID=670580 RepID=A0A1X6MRP7_9APHY|nr:hypothetical protein POSPLADRAFT_1049121 [Postia placenta MAD-698-R-SB12]OSX58969.1 hypothetical protein POSPLADRAFT_1049121 [Postia placenta MAD-698-R-SB12]